MNDKCIICPGCTTHLQEMHVSYFETNTGIAQSILYHCPNCGRDWELETKLIKQTSELKQKFWG